MLVLIDTNNTELKTLFNQNVNWSILNEETLHELSNIKAVFLADQENLGLNLNALKDFEGFIVILAKISTEELEIYLDENPSAKVVLFGTNELTNPKYIMLGGYPEILVTFAPIMVEHISCDPCPIIYLEHFGFNLVQVLDPNVTEKEISKKLQDQSSTKHTVDEIVEALRVIHG
jgi:hypothetical protein